MSKFHAGDEVIVVDGVYECVHGPTNSMIEMIGSVVHILSADESDKSGFYKVVEDPHRWNWCDKCFELYSDENEIRVSDEEFDEILSSLLIRGDDD